VPPAPLSYAYGQNSGLIFCHCRPKFTKLSKHILERLQFAMLFYCLTISCCNVEIVTNCQIFGSATADPISLFMLFMCFLCLFLLGQLSLKMPKAPSFHNRSG